MKVEIKDADYSQKELTIEVPYETYLAKEDEELVKLLPTVNLPGFRKGKAPKEVVRKQFAHRLKSATLERVVNESANQAILDNNLRMVNKNFYLDKSNFEENKPLTFTIRVEVFPSLENLKYKDYDFEKVEIELTDDVIEEQIEAIRENLKTLEPIEDREAQNGDVVNIDFKGFLNDEPFPGGTADGHQLELGSHSFIEGFEEGVVGMKVGETKDLNLTFPTEYHADLAGKDVVFKVTLNSIKHYVKPEIDDDFAKEVNPKCETVKDMREFVKKSLEAEYGKLSIINTLTSLLNKIIEENKVTVPLTLVKERAEMLAYNALNQYYQSGIDPKQLGLNMDEFAQNYYPLADTQTKQSLIITEIARVEKLEVTDEDYTNVINQFAELHGNDFETLKNDIEKAGNAPLIKSDILGEKVYKFLESVNKVTTKKMTVAEYNEYKKNSDNDVQKIEI